MNVWANELGLYSFDWLHASALRKNARLLARAPVHRVDVGMCNGQPFLLWAGCGFDAQVVKQLEPRPRFEKYIAVPRYVAASVWSATMWHGMDLHVWNGDQSVDGHFLLAVATNIRKYAGGMAVLSPGAYIDDGEMDLWLMSGNNIADAFRHFFDLLGGRHLTSEEARKLPFQRVRIEFGDIVPGRNGRGAGHQQHAGGDHGGEAGAERTAAPERGPAAEIRLQRQTRLSQREARTAPVRFPFQPEPEIESQSVGPVGAIIMKVAPPDDAQGNIPDEPRGKIHL